MDDPPATRAARSRSSDPHLAFVVEYGTAKVRAQRREPEMKVSWDATNASLVDGAGPAISARTAGGRSRASGHRLRAEEEKLRGALASAAMERELGAWRTFKENKPVVEGALSECRGHSLGAHLENGGAGRGLEGSFGGEGEPGSGIKG